MSDTLERFNTKYQSNLDGCWIWTGAVSSNGYGCFYFENTVQSAHVASYKIHVGPVPPGLELDHVCAVFTCVNPHHLEPVTHAENLRRAYERKPKKLQELCKFGHCLSGKNLAIWGGVRYCKMCNARRSRESLLKVGNE